MYYPSSNNVPAVPGIEQNPSCAANVANWLSRLSPEDLLNQYGDVQMLNASFGSSSGYSNRTPSMASQCPSSQPPLSPGNAPLNISGGSGLSSINAPSFASSTSGRGGALAIPGGQDPPVNLGVVGVIQLDGVVANEMNVNTLSPSRPARDYYHLYNLPTPDRLGHVSVRDYNSPLAAGFGVSTQEQPSFASTCSTPPRTPFSVPSPGNFCTPTGPPPMAQPRTPFSVPGPGNSFTPPGAPPPPRPPSVYGTPQYSPVSVPSPGNNFTPPFCGPVWAPQHPITPQPLYGPVSVPSPGNNFTPPGLPFRTPPRPEVLLGENLNISGASAGGLSGVSIPVVGTPCSDIVPPVLGENLNLSGLSVGGLSNVSQPSGISQGSSIVPPTPKSLCGERLNLNLSNRSGGLEGMEQPNFNMSGGRTPELNISNRSGLSSIGPPSFNSTFSEDRSYRNASPQDMIQFSPIRSPNLMEFSPENVNQGQTRNFTPIPLVPLGMGVGTPPEFMASSPFGIRRLSPGGNGNEIVPSSPSPFNQSQRSDDSEIDRMAEMAFGPFPSPSPPRRCPAPVVRSNPPTPPPQPSTPVAYNFPPPQPPTPDTPSTPQTSAMNRMVREAHQFLDNMSP